MYVYAAKENVPLGIVEKVCQSGVQARVRVCAGGVLLYRFSNTCTPHGYPSITLNMLPERALKSGQMGITAAQPSLKCVIHNSPSALAAVVVWISAFVSVKNTLVDSPENLRSAPGLEAAASVIEAAFSVLSADLTASAKRVRVDE